MQAVVEMNRHPEYLMSTFDIFSLTNEQQGFSNITSGFEKAKSTFNSTSKLKVPLIAFLILYFTGCHCFYGVKSLQLGTSMAHVYFVIYVCLGQMIMVLTDGNFVKSTVYNDSALQQMVTSLSLEGVIVFFFSLGNDTKIIPDPLTELRKLSCLMNSTVNYVSLLDAEKNPLWAIRPYFDYQAVLRYTANRSFWTDVYEDLDGLGKIATVTYPGQLILLRFLEIFLRKKLFPLLHVCFYQDLECCLIYVMK